MPQTKKPAGGLKDINKRDKKHGETKLLRAAKAGNIDAVRKLIKEGADVNIKDFFGWAPLHEAEEADVAGPKSILVYILSLYLQITKLLVKAKADINALGPTDKGEHGNTPLQEASMAGNHAIAQVLLEANADINRRNNQGKRAIDIAKDEKMVKLLQKAEAEARRAGKKRKNESIQISPPKVPGDKNNKKVEKVTIQGEAQDLKKLRRPGCILVSQADVKIRKDFDTVGAAMRFLKSPSDLQRKLLPVENGQKINGWVVDIPKEGLDEASESSDTPASGKLPVIIVQPTGVVEWSGPKSRAVFYCEAKSETPCSYRWEQGGRALKDGELSDTRDNIRGSCKNTMVISNLRSDISKRRTVRTLRAEPVYCVVANSAGEVKSNEAKFEVKLSPRDHMLALKRDYQAAQQLANRLDLQYPPKIALRKIPVNARPCKKDADFVTELADVLSTWVHSNRVVIQNMIARKRDLSQVPTVEAPSKVSVEKCLFPESMQLLTWQDSLNETATNAEVYVPCWADMEVPATTTNEDYNVEAPWQSFQSAVFEANV
eukprot:m.200791 g.200791  ORF g.200791 m.200791 type:complete len:546 (+) comp15740_c0_seq15:121-1758(+)